MRVLLATAIIFFVCGATFVANSCAGQLAPTKGDTVSELPSYEHRWALVIGVGKYETPFESLAGDRDAKILAKALVKYGQFPRDHVILLVNDSKNPLYRPTYKSIHYWLNEISQRTLPNDLWLIAFSGHGMHLDASPGYSGGDFMVPSDAKFSTDPYFLMSEFINLDTIAGYLRLSGVRQTMLLLDLCRDSSGAGQHGSQNLPPTAINALNANIGPSIDASAVMFATSGNHSAYQDEAHDLGFFSEYFVDGLAGEAANSHGLVTLSSLVAYIKKEVPEQAHHQIFEKHLDERSQQIPDIYLSGYRSDDLVLYKPDIKHAQGEANAALTLAAEPIEVSDDVSGPIFSLPRPIDIAGGKFPNSIAIGDFNGDGKLDIVTANQESNDVSVVLGKGDGTFMAARRFPAGDEPYTVAVGDFNGDGKLDIAVANIAYKGKPTVSILLGRGDGTFEDARNFPSNEQPTKIVAIDLNGDGKLDLVVGNRTNATVSVLLGNGDGTFQVPISYSVDLAPYSVAVGTFTSIERKAKSDLAVANGDGHSLSILLNAGNGTFRDSDNYPVDTGCWGPQSVKVGDFDSDGNLDLVMTDFSNSSIGLLLGNGDGTFQGGTMRFPVGRDVPPPNDDCSNFNTSSSNPTSGPFDVVVADFNGDKKLDVATANNNDSVTVLLGNGDGTFQAPKIYPGESSPVSIAAGDFDGDGRLDVVTANRAGNNVSILMNISNQTKMVLTSQENPSKFGAHVSFTAKVATDFGPALGYVYFKSDSYILGRILLDNGTATIDTYALKPGDHSITAKFVGSAQFGGTEATITQAVEKIQ